MDDQIEMKKTVDGDLVVLRAPEHAVINDDLMNDYGVGVIQVTPTVIYIDAVNPALYRIVGQGTGTLELRRIHT